MSQTTLPRFANRHGAIVTVRPDGPNFRTSCQCGYWDVDGTDGAARRTAQAHAEKCLALPPQ